MFLIKSLAFLISAYSAASAQKRNIFSVSGDINVAFLLNDCQNATETLTYSQNTLINSAIWTTERINFLETIFPLTFGLSVYQTCSEIDSLKTVFDLYQNDNNSMLSIVTLNAPGDKLKKFSDVLDIRTKIITKFYNSLIKATIEFLKVVGWRENVTVVTTDQTIMELIYKHSKTFRICIKECYIIEDLRSMPLNATGEDPLVFFGTTADINQFIINDPHLEDKYAANDITTIFVPLDGDVPTGLPEGSFVILPPYSPPISKSNNNILPTPLLFEIADPLLNLVISTKNVLAVNCNDTIYKLNCLKSKLTSKMEPFFFTLPSDILKTLRIDPLEEYFVYDIFKVENSNSNDTLLVTRNLFLKPYRKIFTYNIFYDNLTLIDETFEIALSNETKETLSSNICFRRFIIRQSNRILGSCYNIIITFRRESWIYAFVSLALLGIIFCIAILTFLFVSIFQRNILEGNPVLTLLLLFAVMLIFSSVLPFSIESNKAIAENLCLIKALSITLSYATLFSLLLSRSILLSTAAKEVGFMSHVAGSVQSFLCLFIFGVQAALSLQFIGRCKDIFHSYSFIYLISYNIMLLLLLICLVPLIYKSQRNYREGKYFSIAIILITLVWCIWLPSFALLCKDWREFMLCFGLISTGGICLGAIFIPRTYLMTIAAERDKITSALPSLATATSAMDLYRAHTQPIYDCVNVAAINAAAVARAGVTPSAPATTLQQPDLYSCPALPEDIDFDLRCDSPTNTDKVTRF